jgi:hypothetical protein
MELFVRIWENYPIAIDMVLYFFVFGAAARVAFAKSFPGHEGKALSVAVWGCFSQQVSRWPSGSSAFPQKIWALLLSSFCAG